METINNNEKLSQEEPETAVMEHFPNLLKVFDFLRGEGYRIAKSTLYRHRSEGKIRPAKDDTYQIKAVSKYAARFLKRKGEIVPSASSANLFVLQERKIKAEASRLEAQARHWEIKADAATGAYVPRGHFEAALAARATVFKSDLHNLAHALPSAIVGIVQGDPEKIPDLIVFLLNSFENILDRYASDGVLTPLPPPVEEVSDDTTTGEMAEDEDDPDFIGEVL
jgi:hypothetical protein